MLRAAASAASCPFLGSVHGQICALYGAHRNQGVVSEGRINHGQVAGIGRQRVGQQRAWRRAHRGSRVRHAPLPAEGYTDGKQRFRGTGGGI
jgi:hypothetical protein